MFSTVSSFVRPGVVTLAALVSLQATALAAPFRPIIDPAVTESSANKPMLVEMGEGRDHGPGYRIWPRHHGGGWDGGGRHGGGRWNGDRHWNGGWGGHHGWHGGHDNWGPAFALGLGLGLPLGYYGGGYYNNYYGGYYDNYYDGYYGEPV